jgi:translation initiation factor 2B subunit (eIF-2B alpha/beta/delta family)
MSVNLLEYTPLAIGIAMVQKLNEHKIKTTLFPDIAIKQAIFNSDICFIGGEALINGKGTVAKTGSQLVAELSKKHNIPTYLCFPTLKYYHKNLANNMLQPQAKNTAQINVKTYEEVSDNLLNGYVCEHGIFNKQNLLKEMKFYSSWMFM